MKPRPSSLGGWLFVALFLFIGISDVSAASSVSTNSAGVLVLISPFGDLNNDGQIDIRDVVCITLHLTGNQLLSTQIALRADLNQDGAVNDGDRRILANMIACRQIKAEEDFDEDELSNIAEFLSGTNPFHPDSDSDGGLDGWEVVEGTNPLDAQSRMNINVVAQPGIVVIHPMILNEDTNGVINVVAHPPIEVVFPAFASEEEIGAITVASPPIEVIFPAFAEAEEAGAIVVAGPPIEVVFPAFLEAEELGGIVVAQPPIELIFPAPLNEDTNILGAILAMPPVTVVNPNQ